ncbi:MAG: SDR family oxidoreductase [Alphaproteobacteria bacterium]|nr:SDR family oxidoreductase [Alphaproteobacteria bacterium]
MASGRLDGKVIVVTGGTAGIGRRMVERFAAEGARVVFTGRRAELGQAVAAATGATFLPADAGEEADAARTIRAAVDIHGRLDGLVNNAGAPGPVGRIETILLERYDQTMAVHVRGALAHIKHVAPVMRAQGSGSIVNIGSVAAHRANYSSSVVYAIAKAAVVHLTRCAAMELGEDRVRVNSISPGAIVTGIFGKAMGLDPGEADAKTEPLKAAFTKLQAVPRAGLPDDIAAAAVFLLSDEGSFVNGADIVVDGGMIWGHRYSEVSAGGHIWKTLFDQ